LRIHRSLRIRSSKGELILKALFDTGASFTVMGRDVAESRSYPSNRCEGSRTSGWRDEARSSRLHPDFDNA
jgi:hypothetical protein